MKKFRIGAVLAAVILSLGMAPAVLAQARSLTVLEMMQTEKRVEAKVEPKDNAEVGKIYEAGEVLLIVEGGNKEWDAVAYQGNVYYIKKTEITEVKVPVVTVEDTEANTIKEVVFDEKFKEELNAEIEVEVHEGKAFVESYTRYQEETRQKRIWGAIIGVLIAAIFGVSIYSYISVQKEDKKK